jgi:hypothetical protein
VNAAHTVSGRRAKLLKRVAFKVCDVTEVVIGFFYLRGRRMPLDGDLACLLKRVENPAQS